LLIKGRIDLIIYGFILIKVVSNAIFIDIQVLIIIDLNLVQPQRGQNSMMLHEGLYPQDIRCRETEHEGSTLLLSQSYEYPDRQNPGSSMSKRYQYVPLLLLGLKCLEIIRVRRSTLNSRDFTTITKLIFKWNRHAFTNQNRILRDKPQLL